MSTFIMFIIYLTILILLLVILKYYFNGPSSHISNLDNKIAIVTGSSSSIGRETAFELVKQGCLVVFACRNESKTIKEINKLESKYKNNAVYMNLNLNSFNSIKNFCDQFKTKFNKLDFLVNNAGTIYEKFTLSEDNIEATLQTNTIGPILLTDLLMDIIIHSKGKIINVSSDAHKYSNVDFKQMNYKYFIKDEIKQNTNITNKELNETYNTSNNLINNINNEDFNWSYYVMFKQYCFSKLGNIYFTQYLDDYSYLTNKIFYSYSIHPGFIMNQNIYNLITTNLLVKVILIILFPLMLIVSKTQNKGAQTTLHCIYNSFSSLISGGYYKDCKIGSLGNIAKADQKETRKEYILKCMELIEKSKFGITNNYKFNLKKL